MSTYSHTDAARVALAAARETLKAELITEPAVGYEVRVLRLRQAFAEHAEYWRVVITNNRTGEIVQRDYTAMDYTAADAAADLLSLVVGEVR